MRIPGIWAVMVVTGALVATGCTSRADFERMRRDQREMRARQADIQANLEAVKRKVDTTVEDDSLRRALATVDSVESRLAALEATVQTLASAQVHGVAAGGGAAGLQSGVPRTQAATLAWSREAERMASGDIDPEYQRGLQLYREGQTEQAIQILRGFVNKNPKSDLADNAQFWLGEAYYSRGDYNRAIIELNEVLLKHPQGDQIPSALLSLATAFANSGDRIDARLILQKLISDHPDSEEAAIGREQLAALAD